MFCISGIRRCTNLILSYHTGVIRSVSVSRRFSIKKDGESNKPPQDKEPEDPDDIPEAKRNRKPADYIPMDPETADPFKRAMHVLKWDFRKTWETLKGGQRDFRHQEAQIFPQFCDILVIGGGIMGSAVAYFMKQISPISGPAIVVVEKDPSYVQAASVNSMGLVRTQFSQEVNVKAALFGVEFLRKMNEHLNLKEMEPKDVEWNPQGFLFLGSQADVALMEVNHRTQLSAGAKVALMTPEILAARYPWLNLEGIALGSYGLDHEGWFDPWKLLYALKEKNMSMGIHYIDGEVTGFENDKTFGETMYSSASGVPFQRIKRAVVDSYSHGIQKIQFAFVVNAAGIEAPKVASLAGIGEKPGLRCIPIPIEKRKRYLYAFHCPDGPKLSFPILIDPNGISVRRDGLNGMYMCSYTPKTNDEEPDPRNRKPDEQFFEDVLWPKLAYRVPAFQTLKLRGCWSTFYDYNYFDQSPIIGYHPYVYNMYLACGFSGYPLQHAPAAAKVIMDMLYDVTYGNDVDMKSLLFERLIHFEPIQERVIV